MQEKTEIKEIMLFQNIDYKGLEEHLNKLRKDGYKIKDIKKASISLEKAVDANNFEYFCESYPFTKSRKNKFGAFSTHLYDMESEGFEFVCGFKDINIFENHSASKKAIRDADEKSWKNISNIRFFSISVFISFFMIFLASSVFLFWPNIDKFINLKQFMFMVFIPLIFLTLSIMYLRRIIFFYSKALRKKFASEKAFKFGRVLMIILISLLILMALSYVALDIYNFSVGNITLIKLFSSYFFLIGSALTFLVYKLLIEKVFDKFFPRFLFIAISLFMVTNLQTKLLDMPINNAMDKEIFEVDSNINQHRYYNNNKFMSKNFFIDKYTKNYSYTTDKDDMGELLTMTSEHYHAKKTHILDYIYKVIKDRNIFNNQGDIEYLSFDNKFDDDFVEAYIASKHHISSLVFRFKDDIYIVDGNFRKTNEEVINEAIEEIIKDRQDK